MVCSAVVASDFGTCELIFVVSLTPAHRTRRYCFAKSFYCVLISETCFAAHWSFIIIVNFSSCFFLRDLYDSRWLFSLKVSRSGVDVVFLVLSNVASCTTERLYSFFSSLP